MLLSLVRNDNLGATTTIVSNRDDGTGANQDLTFSVPPALTLDFANFSYFVTLNGGNDSPPGPHQQDFFYGLTISYTDPGPRNH
jgi:hypothetical protein